MESNPLPQESSGAAIAGSSARDAKAEIRAAFEAHADYVWNTLRRLGIRDGDLEDLTHETFITALRSFANYDPSRPIRRWLYGIAVNVAIAHRRLARSTREIPDDEIEVVDPSPGIDEQLDRQRNRALVLSCLDAIGIDRRAVFVMHELDGVPIPEVAHAIGIPVSTAYSRLRLARDEFAEAVQRTRRKRGER